MVCKAYLNLTISCSSVPLNWNCKMLRGIKKPKVNSGIDFLCFLCQNNYAIGKELMFFMLHNEKSLIKLIVTSQLPLKMIS